MIYFIADIHLAPHAPEVTRRFLDFFNGPAREAESVYILGDLFEVWIGDDDLSRPFHQSITHALAACAAVGTKIFVLRGNRDFLLGPEFATAAGVSLLTSPTVLSVPAWQFVLCHGDALCTGDLEFQAFRAMTQQPEWQAEFLARPLEVRRQEAQRIRDTSDARKRTRPFQDYMDVNPGATEDFLRDHGYATLIHGHTHRPGKHDHIVDGIHVERWVLGDWSAQQGNAIVWNGEHLSRIIFDNILE